MSWTKWAKVEWEGSGKEKGRFVYSLAGGRSTLSQY